MLVQSHLELVIEHLEQVRADGFYIFTSVITYNDKLTLSDHQMLCSSQVNARW